MCVLDGSIPLENNASEVASQVRLYYLRGSANYLGVFCLNGDKYVYSKVFLAKL